MVSPELPPTLHGRRANSGDGLGQCIGGFQLRPGDLNPRYDATHTSRSSVVRFAIPHVEGVPQDPIETDGGPSTNRGR